MASSIHIEEVKTASFAHNDRSMKVSYLIDDSSRNYCSCSADAAAAKFHELKAQAIENYKKRTKQNIQKSTKFLKEAIVNLEAHHTEKDLKPIIKKLESYGYTVLQVAIHRDEGFKSADTNEKKYNYHAHITLFNLDVQTGKSIKFGKNYRTELSRLQTFTADTLKMERGKCSDETHAQEIQKEYNAKQTRRLGTHEFKRKAKEEELKVLAKQKELNGQIEDLRKELIASKSASKEDYRVLKEEKERLQKQIKNKELFVDNLQTEIKDLREKLLKSNDKIELIQKENEHLKAVVQLKEIEIEEKDQMIEKQSQKIKRYENTFFQIAPNAKKPSDVLEYVENLRAKVKKITEEKELSEQNAQKYFELSEMFEFEAMQKQREINDLRTLINDLRTQKESQARKIYELEKKINSRANMSHFDPEIQKDLQNYKKTDEYQELSSQNIQKMLEEERQRLPSDVSLSNSDYFENRLK